MDAQWSIGLAETYFTNPDYLVVQCRVNAFLSPDTVNQTEPHVYHYTKFFEGVVGYMPLGFSCTRLLAVINSANSTLSFDLTAYLAL